MKLALFAAVRSACMPKDFSPTSPVQDTSHSAETRTPSHVAWPCMLQITACVLGKNCRIGKNVTMKHSYLLDDVLVEDGAVLTSALICSQAHIKADAHLLPGAVISYKVSPMLSLSPPLCCRATLHSRLLDSKLGTQRTSHTQPKRYHMSCLAVTQHSHY